MLQALRLIVANQWMAAQCGESSATLQRSLFRGAWNLQLSTHRKRWIFQRLFPQQLWSWMNGVNGVHNSYQNGRSNHNFLSLLVSALLPGLVSLVVFLGLFPFFSCFLTFLSFLTKAILFCFLVLRICSIMISFFFAGSCSGSGLISFFGFFILSLKRDSLQVWLIVCFLLV